MNFVYLDKANSLGEVRIAERTIWGEEIPNFGHSVFYLLMGVNRKQMQTEQIPNSNIFIVPFNKYYCYSMIMFICRLIYLILKENIHYIVIRNSIDLALPALLLSKILKRKVIYIKAYPSIEIKLLQYKGKSRFYAKVLFLKLLLRIDALILNNSNYIISRTIKYSELLKDKYWIKREMLAIPMGIRKRYFDSIPSINNGNQCKLHKNDCLVAIYFGTLEKSRNIEFIIDVINKVVIEKKNIKCYIIGDPQERLIEIRNYADSQGLSANFEFIHTLPRETLFKHIQKANFSLSPIPPIEEFILSSPTKVVESIALGCPVIGNHEIFDQKEIIEQSGGGYLLPYDETVFAKTIIELFDKKQELLELGLCGSKYVLEKRNYTKYAKIILRHLNLSCL